MIEGDENSNLWNVLWRGDQRIATIKKRVILLVGATRAGKSTVFNWKLGRQMIGKENQFGDIYYEKLVNTNTGHAEMGFTFTSVTLAPNISDLNSTISIGDMAGFFDKRDYIGVMAVSYFLKSVMEAATEVKFVLVLDEAKLIERSGEGVISTFQGFIKMFKFNEMSEQIKDFLKSSLSLVVTRCQNKTKHQDYLRKISKQLTDPKLMIKQKATIIQLIAYIIKVNRIDAFEAAQVDNNPQPCTFQERFNQKLGWEYFNIKEANASFSNGIVNLPFKEQFQALEEKQKANFTQAIDRRIKQYSDFVIILKKTVTMLRDKYLHFSSQKPKSLPKHFKQELLNFSSIFEDVEYFLHDNDHYDTRSFITQKVTMPFEKANFIKSLRNMTEIYVIPNKINDCDHDFIENMKNYQIFFEEFIGCLLPLCSTVTQEHSLQRLKFCLVRGFHQFSRLFKIDEQKIIEANQKIKDCCNTDIFDKGDKKQYTLAFLRPWKDRNFLLKLFKDQKQIEEAEEFFNSYMVEFTFIELENTIVDQNEILYSEIGISLSLSKAKLLLQKGEKLKALAAFIYAFEVMNKMTTSYSNLQLYQNDLQNKKNELFMLKLQVIHEIIETLTKFSYKEYSLAKQYALNIAQHIKDVHKSCQVFDIMLEEASKMKVTSEQPEISSKEYNQNQNEQASFEDKEMQILKNYIEYCVKWGRVEKAIQLYQRKLSNEREIYDDYQQTIRNIYRLLEDAICQGKLYEQYKSVLQNWTRLPDKDVTLDQYIEEIKNQMLSPV